MKRIKGVAIIFSILTIILGITTIYYGYQILSNWDNETTVNTKNLMILMMASVSFSIITVYLQWMQNRKKIWK